MTDDGNTSRDLTVTLDPSILFSHFMDALPAAAFIKDAHGRLLFVNPALESFLGTGDYRGRTSADFFREPVAQIIATRDDRARAGEHTVEEISVTGPTGETRTFQVHLFPVQAPEQEPLLGGIALDITRRKRVQEELRRANRALRVLRHCAHTLVEAQDEQSFLADICRVIVSTGGYRMAWVGLVDPEHDQAIRPVAQAGVSQGYLDELTIPWLHDPAMGPISTAMHRRQPQVTRYIVSVMGDPLREAALERGYRSTICLPFGDPRPLGCLNVYAAEDDAFEAEEVDLLRQLADDLTFGLRILRDRMQHRVAEAALMESEERYRNLIETANDAILVADATTGQILDANRQAEVLTGYTRSELEGMHHSEIHPPEHRELVKELFRQVGKGARPSQESILVLQASGDLVPVEVNTNRTSFGGRLVVQGIYRDISNRLRLEEQLHRSQKMEAVGRLAGGVAHDFNNLLTAINGYTDLLMLRLPDSGPSTRFAGEIKKAGERASSLTQQLLAFSRRQVLKREILDPNMLIRDLEKMLRRLIGEDIHFTTRLDNDVACVKADRGQLEQVIMNLVLNGRDAMPSGGELSISTRRVVADEAFCQLFSEANPGEYLCVVVEDGGVGMDPQTVQHIFEPFYTTKDCGTGLGLSVVYGIVRQHGGWIHVYSEPSRGSSFQVYLPALALQEQVVKHNQTSPKQFRGQGQSILLVEDEPSVLQFAKQALIDYGYAVVTAQDANEAEALYAQRSPHFDLVFCDVVLFGRTGLELVDDLLLQVPAQRVLLTSGYTDQRSRFDTIRERSLPFLAKPYTILDLLKAIQEALSSR